ncbi:MAG TPA: MarR family transcriptional regulator [Opitutaceae bacterium]|nr:MarR family transcriptional regulator [Opitutaceae bacterium]
MPPNLVSAVQRHYPQIYTACHVDHVRAASTEYQLSAKDSALLAHLDERTAISAGKLARHLGVAASTLSAALQRLESLGYLIRTPRTRDRRAIELRRTPKGTAAMEATSVLDTRRVAGVLARLRPAERRRAVAGLALLARAALKFQLAHPARRGLST